MENDIIIIKIFMQTSQLIS